MFCLVKIDIVLFRNHRLGMFNIEPPACASLQDPEAAAIVFNSGAPLTMVPLEVRTSVLNSD